MQELPGDKTMTMTVICTLTPGALEKAVGLLNGLTGYMKSDMSKYHKFKLCKNTGR
jgi:hypothetical protein